MNNEQDQEQTPCRLFVTLTRPGKPELGTETILEVRDLLITAPNFIERYVVPSIDYIFNSLCGETNLKDIAAHALAAMEASGEEIPPPIVAEWTLRHSTAIWEPTAAAPLIIAHRLATALSTYADGEKLAKLCPVCHPKQESAA